MDILQRKIKDTIHGKQKRLIKLQKRSTSALNLVNSTIDKLDNIDTEIDFVVEDIENSIEKLTDTKTELVGQKVKNDKIIQKFKALIED